MYRNKPVFQALIVVLFATALISGGFLARLPRQPAVEAAPGQQSSPQRSITVTGYGTAYGPPDIAYMSIGVDNANTEVVAAVNDANTRMQAVIDALKTAGIAAEDIRTEYYNIFQDSSFGPVDPSQPAPERTYRVTNVINVTVRDVTKVGGLLGIAVGAGANVVNNISFDIADRTALESDARVSALQDARSRAEQLANLLGVTLGDVIGVTEGGQGFFGPVASQVGMGGGAGAPISGGTLSVNVVLTVSYAIQ